jgi:tRNA(fMet)-specific endonuclease VapC
VVNWLLDTNTISYAFRNEGAVASRLLSIPRTAVGIPAPVLYEARAGILRLADGARRDRLRAALDRLVQSVEVVAFERQAAETAAAIRARLESLGAPIGPIDLQIAAIAKVRGSTLVTRNLREFARIEGLLVEDWY